MIIMRVPGGRGFDVTYSPEEFAAAKDGLINNIDKKDPNTRSYHLSRYMLDEIKEEEAEYDSNQLSNQGEE